MKKRLLFLSAAFLLFVGTSNAQHIISTKADDFEIWTDDPFTPSIQDPDSGVGKNGFAGNGKLLICLRLLLLGNNPQIQYFISRTVTVVHSGTYSCKIESQVLSATSYGYVKSFIPHDTVGIVFSGVITASPAIKLGVPFTSRPVSINFFYQYFPQNNGKPDTAFCSVVLSHHTAAGRNTIGAGIAQMNSTGASMDLGYCNPFLRQYMGSCYRYYNSNV